LRFEILEKEGYSGHIGADIPESIYFLTRPTDPPPEGVEGKPEIKFDRPNSVE
jgi:hypothetical protein